MRGNPISSRDLAIDLESKSETELFKWLLASLLFGKPIQSSVAARAYRRLVESDITSLDNLLKTSWDELVADLDLVHYVRYDYSTVTKLLAVARELKTRYGTVTDLMRQSLDAHDLEQRLEAVKGIGPVTAGIFLREAAPVWFPLAVSHDYDSARRAAEILAGAGYEAYFIGGAVRDMMLGLVPKDFDIVTNATPTQIMAIPEFTHSLYKDTAQAFGVTRVRLATDHGREVEFEIATFRRDIGAHLGRKATQVEFAELEDDVLRRDFTVNALALDPITGQLIDYVGGLDDLSRKLIRFIGDPSERINEDPLRLMRAVRLKNQLGFTYHRQTKTAIGQGVAAGRIAAIAVDRLRDELTRLLVHPSRVQAVIDLDNFVILTRLLPEVAAGKGVEQPPEFHSEGDVWAHQLLVLEYLPARPGKRLAWAALLHDIGKKPTLTRPKTPHDHIRFNRHYAVGAEMARRILKRLKFSNRDIADISWMIHNHIAIDDIPKMRRGRRQRFFGHPAFADLLELHYIDARASWAKDRPHPEPKFEAIERLWHEYLASSVEQRHPSLKRDLGIDGHWLIRRFGREFQLGEGPVVGRVLAELDEWYQDEGVQNPEAYEARARRLLELETGKHPRKS